MADRTLKSSCYYYYHSMHAVSLCHTTPASRKTASVLPSLRKSWSERVFCPLLLFTKDVGGHIPRGILVLDGCKPIVIGNFIFYFFIAFIIIRIVIFYNVLSLKQIRG